MIGPCPEGCNLKLIATGDVRVLFCLRCNKLKLKCPVCHVGDMRVSVPSHFEELRCTNCGYETELDEMTDEILSA